MLVRFNVTKTISVHVVTGMLTVQAFKAAALKVTFKIKTIQIIFFCFNGLKII